MITYPQRLHHTINGKHVSHGYFFIFLFFFTEQVVDRSDGSKSLKLGDFGLAVEVTEPLYTVCGTPTYVAPEILSESGYGLKVRSEFDGLN